jgi:hypothetical protein
MPKVDASDALAVAVTHLQASQVMRAAMPDATTRSPRRFNVRKASPV